MELDLSQITVGILAILGGLLLARYNFFNPKKTSIKEHQLSVVYLPIVKLLKVSHLNVDDSDTISNLVVGIKEIIDGEILYLHDDFLNIANKFICSVEQNNPYKEDYIAFQKMIFSEYELLKRGLGYPSNSIFDIFMRSSAHKKIQMLSKIIHPLLFLGLITYVFIRGKNTTEPLWTFIFVLYLFAVAYVSADIIYRERK